MEYVIKNFEQLSLNELYEIYKLRCAVFVVEQQCAYQDIDEYDPVCYHIYLKQEGVIKAYCRVLPKGTTFDEVSIGRVISTERRKGYATLIVQKAIEIAKDKFNADSILIEAQTYAKGLYEKVGFQQVSEEFLEDGILHIQMRFICKK